MPHERAVLLVTHGGRADIVELARGVSQRLHTAGVQVLTPQSEVDGFAHDWVVAVPDLQGAPERADITDLPAPELVMVLGGDGTFLRAAEYARPSGAPILGVNLGHVGFLAETDPEELDEAIARVLSGEYHVEERMTLDVEIHTKNDTVRTWALNEASLEKSTRERILEVQISIDDDPLTAFGCDGVLCATPTGSTAYAFSAGGPILWPAVKATLVIPNAAHALFARPLVVGPESHIRLDVADRGHDAVLCADGRRTISVPAGCHVEIRGGSTPINVARVHDESFTDRLVARFALPVNGFRNTGTHPER